jgi:hypothetical protein
MIHTNMSSINVAIICIPKAESNSPNRDYTLSVEYCGRCLITPPNAEVASLSQPDPLVVYSRFTEMTVHLLHLEPS